MAALIRDVRLVGMAAVLPVMPRGLGIGVWTADPVAAQELR